MSREHKNQQFDAAKPSPMENREDVAAEATGDPGETAEDQREISLADQNETAEEISGEEMLSGVELLQRLSAELEATRTRAENYYRKMLRLEADFDNYRRRCQEEKEVLHQLAAEKVITHLLPVLDNLERGLEAADKTRDYEGLLTGLQLVYRGFLEILKQEGLEAMVVKGQEFDPYLHEAMLRMPLEEEQKDNIIVQELRRGYLFKGKVIRPARVAVACSPES